MLAGAADHHQRVLLLRRPGAVRGHVGRLLGVQRRRAAGVAGVARVPVAAQRHQADVQRARLHGADARLRAHGRARPAAGAEDAGDRVRQHTHGARARVRQPVPAPGPGAGPEPHRPAGRRLAGQHGRPARGHAGRQRHRRHQQRRVRPAARAPEAVHGPEQHQLRGRGRVRAAPPAGGAGPQREPVVRLAVPVRVPRPGRAPPAGHARQPAGARGPGRVRRAGQPGGAGAGGQPAAGRGRPRVRRPGRAPAAHAGQQPADRARRPHVPRPRPAQVPRRPVQPVAHAHVRHRAARLGPPAEHVVLLLRPR